MTTDRASDAAPLVRAPAFAPDGGATFAVTTRAGGVSAPPFASLNLGAGTGDAPEAVAENRARVARALGVDPSRMVFVRQVHGRDVVRVDAPWPAGVDPPEADAMVTSVADVALAILVADCVPVGLYDPERRVVAVVHAGWRGTAAGVVRACVEALAAQGSRPAALRAVVGPCIGPCCYVVGDEVVEALRAAWPRLPARVVRRDTDGRARVDLRAANVHVLCEAGVPAGHVAHLGACTSCHTDTFFSHRAENGRTGRFAALVRLHPRS